MKRKPEKKFRPPGQPITSNDTNGHDVSNRSLKTLTLIVALFTFLLYLPALKNGFVNWDDYQYVLENLRIRAFNGAFFRWAFTDTDVALYWHPLTWISHAADYALWGKSAAGHHLTSIILHAVNTGIVVFLVYRLLEKVEHGSAGTTTFEPTELLTISGITGILFGIHPLHAESVVWVAMRKDPLYALFYFLSIICYINYVHSRREAKHPATFIKQGYYQASLLFFILALCSKPMAVTLPAVLLLLDWYPFKRMSFKSNFALLCLEKLPFAAASIIITATTVVTQRAGDILGLVESYPLTTRIAAAFKVLAAYIGRIVMPVNLLPLYPYPEHLSLTTMSFLAAAAGFIAVTGICLYMARRQPFWLAAWLFFLITVAPTLGINQTGANRYIYLSALGIFLLCGLAVSAAWTKARSYGNGARQIMTGAGIVMVISLSFLTLKQIAIWNNSMTLWNYVIENGPPNPSAFNSRGHEFKNAGAFGSAINDYSSAITLKPNWATYYVNRGAAYCEKGDFSQALEDLNKALQLKPGNYMALNNRGSIFFRSGDIAKALDDFNSAIAVNPKGHMAYNNRGMAYKSLLKISPAEQDFDTAISISPDYVDAYYNRSVLHSEKGEHTKALADLNSVIARNPALTQAYLDRGELYAKSGDSYRAIKDYQQACNRGNSIACGKLTALK